MYVREQFFRSAMWLFEDTRIAFVGLSFLRMAANKVTAVRGGLYLDQRTVRNLELLGGPERLFFCVHRTNKIIPS
jgi:hypothetical protein